MSWKHVAEVLRGLRSRKGRRAQGAFSIEGYRLVERAIESQAPLRALLVTEHWQHNPPPRAAALLASAEAGNIPIHWAPEDVLQEFVEGRTFGSVMGIVGTLPQTSLADIASNRETSLNILVLWRVMDPGNIGAMSRTGMASGVDLMLAVEGTDLFHPKAVRTSMGALFDLPTIQIEDGTTFLRECKHFHIHTIGAVVQDGHVPHTTTIPHRHALLMGSEAHGLPADIQKRLDLKWSIPMPEQIDSFSVNAATAVLLYECNRQRWTQQTDIL